MKNATKKTVIILAGILSIALAAGPNLFAAENTSSSRQPTHGLVNTADIAFVTTSSSTGAAVRTNGDAESATAPAPGVISAADAEFSARPFTRTSAATTTHASSDRRPAPGVISAADIGFIDTGGNGLEGIGGTLACVDGATISGGEQCSP